VDEFEGGRRRAHGQRRQAGRSLEKRGPGAQGGGSGGGERRRGPSSGRPPRDFAPAALAAPSVEPEAAKPARALLEEILAKMGLDDVEIVYIARSEGEYYEVRGPRLASLIGREGKTLEALNLIFNNIINAGNRNNRKYYTIDAEGYRARRADQLKTLALATLERVVRDQKPIKLEPMLPSERKIVHLALSDSPFVRTESEGVEPERRLVVYPRAEQAASGDPVR
jgi:spoIIIJ-associated protein